MALEDSAKPFRLEADKLLRLAINHKAATPFLGVARMDPRIYKAAAGDSRSIEFRIGEPSVHDTSDSSTLGFSIKHNSSGELEVFADNGGSPKGLKIASNGNLTVTGNTAFTGTVTGALPAGFPTVLTGTLVHDPPSIPAGAAAEFTVTVTGAAIGDPAIVATSVEAGSLNFWIEGRVTAANTVTVRYNNDTAGAANFPSHTLRAIVFHY